MAHLIYLNNPTDHTITWLGRTMTYEFLAHCRAQGFDPWFGHTKDLQGC